MGHNLPHETTSFVGRADEVSALEDIAGSARVISLVGPPGTGKTRLSLRVADRLLGSHVTKGGVWFVELAAAKTLEDVCAALGATLGALAHDVTDPVSRLGHVLAARGKTLLVLDNFEQVVDAAASAVSSWSKRAPETTFLITSRERLRIPEERVFEVSPLVVPDANGLDRERALESSAVALFIARAPSFALTDDNASELATLLDELDGLPLAIELAAARAPVLGLSELRQRLRHELDVLGHGPRNAEARQATLRGALDWSWALLDEKERRAFCAAAVFSGAFDLPAFEFVLGEPALEALQSLVEKSLITTNPGEIARFAAYSSVRAYAAEKLSDVGESREHMRERHAAWFEKFARLHAERFERDASQEAWQFLARGLDDIADAFEFCLAHGALDRAIALVLAGGAVLTRRGPHALHAAMLDRVIEHAAFARVDALVRARVLRARALHQKDRGQAAAGLGDLERALALVDEAKNPALAGEILADAGFAEQSQGHFESAHAFFDRATKKLESAGDVRAEGRVLAGLGLLLHAEGRLDEAHAAYDGALRAARRARDPFTEAGVEKDVGSLRLQQGRLDEAREHYAKALAFEAALGLPTFGGIIAGNLGILEQERGDFDEARACFEDALETLRHAGSRLLEGHTLGYLAALELECGRHDAARERFGQAVDVLREVGDRRLEGLFWAGRGAADALSDRRDAAREAFDHAAELLAEIGDPGLVVTLELHQAELLLSEAKSAEARGDVNEASKLRERAAERARVSRSNPVVEKSDDARFALRILDRALSSAAMVWKESSAELVLPDGQVVDLSARVPLRRIVAALADTRLTKPGTPLAFDDLLEAGWPGEKIGGDAALNRVKVALSTLRKLGMRDVIHHSGDGWLLDPALPLFRKD